jgi:hypothetical protein
MTTISHEPSAVVGKRRPELQPFVVRDTMTSLAISVIWLAVLLVSLWGPSIETSSAGGDMSHIPVGAAIALLAVPATWAVAKYGFSGKRQSDS